MNSTEKTCCLRRYLDAVNFSPVDIQWPNISLLSYAFQDNYGNKSSNFSAQTHWSSPVTSVEIFSYRQSCPTWAIKLLSYVAVVMLSYDSILGFRLKVLFNQLVIFKRVATHGFYSHKKGLNQSLNPHIEWLMIYWWELQLALTASECEFEVETAVTVQRCVVCLRI